MSRYRDGDLNFAFMTQAREVETGKPGASGVLALMVWREDGGVEGVVIETNVSTET